MQNSHSLLGLVHRTLHKFENSGVPRISRDSITGSDMPSALGLVDTALARLAHKVTIRVTDYINAK